MRLRQLLGLACVFLLALLTACSNADSAPTATPGIVPSATPGVAPSATPLAEIIETREVVPEGEIVEPCTRLNCMHTLTLNFEGPLPDTFTVSVEYPGHTAETALNARCADGVWQTNSVQPVACDTLNVPLPVGPIPEEITVLVRWDAGAHREQARPIYTDFAPNGPNCDPVCQLGSVTIELPSAEE